MEYRMLGKSGCAVSVLALGTMTFGDSTDEEVAFAQLDAFADAGGTLVDTADVYAGGSSESIVGQWLARRPSHVTERVVLATKGRFSTADEPNGIGLSRRHLDRALTGSLRRLGVDTIDLYQVHGWDPLTPLEETLRFLDDAVRSGRVRYVGLSNFTGWQIQKAVDLAGHAGLAGPVTLQPEYNLLSRETEWELVAACEHNGLGVLPWSPLAGGLLTGKYEQDRDPATGTRLGGSRFGAMHVSKVAEERTWAVVDVLAAIAADHAASPAQVALAWLAGRPAVSSVILGARTAEQLADNLGAADLRLTVEETERLDTASQPQVGYPYGGVGLGQRTRSIDGRRAVSVPPPSPLPDARPPAPAGGRGRRTPQPGAGAP